VLLKKLSVFRSIYLLIALASVQILNFAQKPDSLRNSMLLVDAGKNIINRESPYTIPNPYGTSPGLIFLFINKVAIFNLTIPIIIILNLAGYFFLIKFIFPNLNNIQYLIFINVSLLTSPIRALVDNLQNNGIIIGSALVGIYFHKLYKLNHKSICMNLSAICIIFSLEMKPQIILPLIVIYLAQQRNWNLILRIIFIFLLIRISLDLWTGRILEFEQYQIWKNMRTNSLAIKEQISPWKALDVLVPFNIDWFSVSFFVVFLSTLILAFFSFKSKSNKFLVIALFIPLLSGYLQYYSLLPLIVLLIFQVRTNCPYRKFGAMFSLAILTLPTHTGSHFELLEFLLLIVLNLIFAFFDELELNTIILNFMESLLAIFFITLVFKHTNELEIGLSFAITLIFLLQILRFPGYFKDIFTFMRPYETK